MESFLDRLKQRKLFQWALAYVAAGWLVAQVLDVVAEPWGVSGGLVRTAQALLALGFPVVLVLAWYHGEKGRQRVSVTEFVILTSLFVLAGTVLMVFDPLAEVAPVGDESLARVIDPNSIVVLPFLDLSPEGDQEYMSSGIAEELLNLLAQIPELKVISRTTAFSFKDRADLTVPEIATRLGVAHVLEGSVRAAGNAIRITTQLIDARSDTHLFSQNYDGTLDSRDIFALQDSIAAQVVSGLRLTILGELPRLQETDPQAYTLFLRARHIADQEDYETALPMFLSVLETDPDHVPSLVEVAVIYSDQIESRVRPLEEGLRLGHAAIDRALSIDPDFAYAHALRGALLTASGELATAVLHFERAIELAPTSPEILMGTGNFLWALGRLDESIAFYEYVAELDPLYPVNLNNLARVYYYTGRLEDAVATARTVLELSPDFPGARLSLGLSLLEVGELEEALETFESETLPPARIFGLVLANQALGRQAAFDAAFQEIQEDWGALFPGGIAWVHALSGDADAAFEWLDRVEAAMARNALDLPFAPAFADLYDDARWTAFLERVGASEEQLAAIPFEARVPERN